MQLRRRIPGASIEKSLQSPTQWNTRIKWGDIGGMRHLSLGSKPSKRAMRWAEFLGAVGVGILIGIEVTERNVEVGRKRTERMIERSHAQLLAESRHKELLELSGHAYLADYAEKMDSIADMEVKGFRCTMDVNQFGWSNPGVRAKADAEIIVYQMLYLIGYGEMDAVELKEHVYGLSEETKGMDLETSGLHIPEAMYLSYKKGIPGTKAWNPQHFRGFVCHMFHSIFKMDIEHKKKVLDTPGMWAIKALDPIMHTVICEGYEGFADFLYSYNEGNSLKTALDIDYLFQLYLDDPRAFVDELQRRLLEYRV